MKKHFSDEQIISILREAEARVSVRELCRKHAIFDATFAPGVRNMAVPEVKRLTCLGDFMKECLTITTAFGISGVQVTRILDCIALFRCYSATIRADQGPEFTCRILEQWVFEQNVELRLIQPGEIPRCEMPLFISGREAALGLVNATDACAINHHQPRLCSHKARRG